MPGSTRLGRPPRRDVGVPESGVSNSRRFRARADVALTVEAGVRSVIANQRARDEEVFVSISERIQAALAAASKRRPANRETRSERPLKRQAAKAHRTELKHGASSGRPGWAPGSGSGAADF
jgi:hypothetical protein